MIIPLLHAVVILPDSVEQTSAGGIIIPEQVTERERKAVEYGTVVRVGPRAFMDYGRGPDILSTGDRVSYARYAGKTVTDTDGKEYLLVNDQDILCLVTEEL